MGAALVAGELSRQGLVAVITNGHCLNTDIRMQLLAKFKRRPPERQREVLDFVDALERKNAAGASLPPLAGLVAGMGHCPTAEEIDEARREAWAGFPRKDI